MDVKKVLLGVTGGIAAYKSAEICRALQKKGIDVRVIMTENATRFISPLTFAALSGHDVHSDLFGDPKEPILHIDLARDSDLFLIAPCTANMLAKIANGIADDLMSSTALAMASPVIVAPAMNVHMYENAATQHNLCVCRQRGIHIVEPAQGRLACGDEGRGKLADVDDIVSYASSVLFGIDGASDETRKEEDGHDLRGKKVLITAGPTVEPIDAVRSITNRSSGKMGYAIADCAKRRGADVVLVSGPVSIDAPAGVDLIKVETAEEMLSSCEDPFTQSDIAVFCAAVADLRPLKSFDRKLKKGIDDEALSTIDLVPNPDIIATLAAKKRDDQVVVGFAAETDDVIENAKQKLNAKHADMIVANKVGGGLAFGCDYDEVSFVTEDDVLSLPLMDKAQIADRLLDQVLKC
ncbi:MAG: bifunctional phosphopantothenoylcysteine decarboxylase/phosphopantothenate--cysteine ligase CoaBC [Eggerthellaceae bacterium]|nr:bifunctional phosphopantothenoylcysteine decarboxylase/phosphopantothenate--cysteine ligase CoaBC [Eggerthellaceae bacterium]